MVITAAALLGFLLRLWTMAGGVDAEGLYASSVFAWILLWIVTLAVPVLIIVMVRPLTVPVKYNMNFPKSIVSAVGCLMAALGFVLAGVDSFSGAHDIPSFLTGVLGLGSGVSMLLVAYARFRGEKPNFLFHCCACLFMALRTFDLCRSWGNQPQIHLFLFALLAQISVMLAAYQLCCFDAEMGNRRVSLFWSLLSVYLCMLALPSAKDILFYGCIAIWLLTNLCSLKPAKKRKPVAQEPENPVQAQIPGSDVSMDEIMTWLEEE